MRTVLIYHVYIKNDWKEVTKKILSGVPHDDIIVNFSIDWYKIVMVKQVQSYFKKIPKVIQITFTFNNKKSPEVKGFDKLREVVNLNHYNLLTYAHGKGVSKPYNQNIKDWVELMRYFVIERLDLCIDVFKKGYWLYGVNIGEYKDGQERSGPFKFSDFHYSGNFVSINLDYLREKFLQTHCDEDYFGVEGFWGKLCAIDKAFCAHTSSPTISNHYNEGYPQEFYK